MKQRLRIGWREWIRLPSLVEGDLRAKIDTGARTSALHARNLRITDVDGHIRARFDLRPDRPRPTPRRTIVIDVIDMRQIKSSNGLVELRPVIRTQIMLGGRVWPIQITLTNRRDMSYAMLIGREALGGRVTIEPGKSYLTEGSESP